MLNKFIWLIWGAGSLSLAAYYIYQFEWSEDKSPLLIGETSHGHHQIELACSTCHTEPFGGPEILHTACLNCHSQELTLADDSHPRKKFTDPRNADRVAILDARYCVTCHSEHKRQNTLAMGLTIPSDYCFQCHQNIDEDRPSHAGMGFDTCASSGCHNYHDNRALYEDFLVQHANEPKLLIGGKLPSLLFDNQPKQFAHQLPSPGITYNLPAGAPLEHLKEPFVGEWQTSTHARKDVNCSDCHQPKNSAWINKPGISECKICHEFQVQGFTSGKHGMRLSEQLSSTLGPITPAKTSRLDFHKDSLNKEQNCQACHNSHQYDTQFAAVDACLTCHNDEHSRAFKQSPHFQLFQLEVNEQIEFGHGVSCASCHLPRETHTKNGVDIVNVQHNQNGNLRPNEKMIRSV